MIHELKCWPEVFQDIYIGTKEFEVRKNDRGFKVGDHLHLREWNPKRGEYTGRHIVKRITYILQSQFGLPEDICVMQLR